MRVLPRSAAVAAVTVTATDEPFAVSAVSAATEPISAAALTSAAVAPAAPMRGRRTIVLQCSIGDVH